jgi:ankyrin repeat protein
VNPILAEQISVKTRFQTPLSRAAEKGNEAVVQLLLEKGADPSKSDSGGRTPLSRAVEKGNEAVVRLLKPLSPNSWSTIPSPPHPPPR